MGEKWTEMLFMKMVSAAPASRSEEEDRELVPRRRGPAGGRSAWRRIGEHSMWMICGAPSTWWTYMYVKDRGRKRRL